ncbi:MAG: ParB N-terminal domain-containing protein [Pseudomonadota bacterium]
MKIEVWNLDRIRPYPNNPRINDDAVDAVAASIREFGVRQAIVVDTDGVIICGHTRFKAAQKLGLEKLPVHVAKDLTPEQIKAYLWVRFIDDEDATAKALIKRPIAAYVEQVYPYGNFANLGIGV